MQLSSEIPKKMVLAKTLKFLYYGNCLLYSCIKVCILLKLYAFVPVYFQLCFVTVKLNGWDRETPWESVC